MLLVDDLAAGGTKNLRHTPRGLVTLAKARICLFVDLFSDGKNRCPFLIFRAFFF